MVKIPSRDPISHSRAVPGIASVCFTPAPFSCQCLTFLDLQGQGLAMLEMTLAVATVLRRYDLTIEPGFNLEILPSFTLRPKNGLRILVNRRTS